MYSRGLLLCEVPQLVAKRCQDLGSTVKEATPSDLWGLEVDARTRLSSIPSKILGRALRTASPIAASPECCLDAEKLMSVRRANAKSKPEGGSSKRIIFYMSKRFFRGLP